MSTFCSFCFLFLVVVIGVLFGLLIGFFFILGIMVFRILIRFCTSFIGFINSIFFHYLSVYLFFI